MRVHHLNCATMCPAGGRLIDGVGGPLRAGRIVAHCLLVETAAGLVLVDTGLGTQDVAHPGRLPVPFRVAVRPRLDPGETAVRQVERLGFAASDVRHIVLTHLDVDHAGGLGDFPGAEVHVLADEHEAAMRRASVNERGRYLPVHWAHRPRWALHRPGGDRWMGFESVHALDASAGAEIVLVPLPGHTRGHAAVAVRTDDRWLMHCGDAYFFRDETDPDRPRCSPGLALFQRIVAVDNRARLHNRDRLRALRGTRGAEVTLFCAHDAVQLERLAAAG